MPLGLGWARKAEALEYNMYGEVVDEVATC